MTTPIQFQFSHPTPSVNRSPNVETSGPEMNRFGRLMLESLDHVNSMQQDADRAVEMLATGGDIQTAQVLTSMQKADMTFRLMLQIRNKLMQAYQEINEIRI